MQMQMQIQMLNTIQCTPLKYSRMQDTANTPIINTILSNTVQCTIQQISQFEIQSIQIQSNAKYRKYTHHANTPILNTIHSNTIQCNIHQIRQCLMQCTHIHHDPHEHSPMQDTAKTPMHHMTNMPMLDKIHFTIHSFQST